MTITITAVIPTFDRPELLVKAVASVLGQSSPADEVIVVDNGTIAVSKDLLPESVKLLRIAPRAGVSAARNAGAAAAISEFVAFLDDDDRWDLSYLAEVREAVQGHAVTPDVVLGRKDREVAGVASPYKQITSLEGLRDLLMVKNPGVGGQNITVRRAFMQDFGGFRTELHGPEDRAFLVDALDHGAEVLLAQRAIVVKVIHPGEQITDGRHSLRSTWRFLRIYWRSMNRRQLAKNVKRLRRSVARSASMRARGPRKAHQ
jgi:glycosyltransferase involved in cell wall biosynthesis